MTTKQAYWAGLAIGSVGGAASMYLQTHKGTSKIVQKTIARFLNLAATTAMDYMEEAVQETPTKPGAKEQVETMTDLIRKAQEARRARGFHA